MAHRDIKPANIILHDKMGRKRAAPPSELTLKLADFGYSRQMPEITHDVGSQMLRTYAGTESYMAPEVLTSSFYDARADLWSIGTALYYCLEYPRLPYEVCSRYRFGHESQSLG